MSVVDKRVEANYQLKATKAERYELPGNHVFCIERIEQHKRLLYARRLLYF